MTLSDKIVQVRGRTPANEMNGLFDCEVCSTIDIREAVRELKKIKVKVIRATEEIDLDGKSSNQEIWIKFSDFIKTIDEIFGEKLI